MIFNEDLIFIHIGKTGGLSCSHYLLKNLPGEINNCHDRAENEIRKLGLEDRNIIARPDIGFNRHNSLSEALAFIKTIKNKQLNDFKRVLVVIRHPITLEYSYFKHIQKPRVKKRRKNTRFKDLSGRSFEYFIEHAPYHRSDHPQEAFFLIDGKIPENVTLIKFENLAEEFTAAVREFLPDGEKEPFPHRNKSKAEVTLEHDLSEREKELIYKKHAFMFDEGFYTLDI